MKNFLILTCTISFISCESRNTQVVEILNTKTIIVAKYVEGQIDGEALYYTSEGVLKAKYFYTKGIKNGLCVNYHSNGRVYDSVVYNDGKRIGDYSIFDTAGGLEYQSYYIEGTTVGPQMKFTKNVLSKYGFRSFDKMPIFYCEYDSIGKVKEFGGDIPNAVAYETFSEDKEFLHLFMYFPNPPGIDLEYFIGLYNNNTKEINEIIKLNSNRLFLDTILEKPQQGWNYYVSTQIFDSISNVVRDKMKVLNSIN